MKRRNSGESTSRPGSRWVDSLTLEELAAILSVLHGTAILVRDDVEVAPIHDPCGPDLGAQAPDDDLSDIPVSYPRYRLNRLQLMSERAEQAGDFALAARLIAQGAREAAALACGAPALPDYRPMAPGEARERIRAWLAAEAGEAGGEAGPDILARIARHGE